MDQLKILELRPNRKLIDTQFDGYKLSLEPIAKAIVTLDNGPNQMHPNDDQYSLLHAQLFGLHNHLIRDPWEPRSGYFIDTTWMVQKITYNVNTGNMHHLNSVFKIPPVEHKESGDYNLTLYFVSEKYCVLSTGTGILHLIDTGDRYTNSEWKCLFAGTVDPVESKQFVIQDARLEINDGNKSIHCILLSITKPETKHQSNLNWICLKNDAGDKWSITGLHEIRCKSLPSYCAIEPKCKAILVSADCPLVWAKDKDIENNQQIEEENFDNLNQRKANYVWSQTDEDVTINLDIDMRAEKQDFKVICKDTYVAVTYKANEMFNSELYDRLDYGLTTWTLENETLQLNLVKLTANKYWPKLTSGQDDAKAEEIPLNENVPHYVLTEKSEECDGLVDSENEYYFGRIDSSTHKLTHKINLGVNKPLFEIPLRPGQPPALSIRIDVDACIWLPKSSHSSELNEWQLTHEGTINAFGYVQASKQQKRFIQCAPDMSYAVICESSRHVFFYLGTYNSAGSLKNRNGGKVSIGQQKLFTMDGSDQLLGLLVENEVTFLLTKNSILCLKINV